MGHCITIFLLVAMNDKDIISIPVVFILEENMRRNKWGFIINRVFEYEILFTSLVSQIDGAVAVTSINCDDQDNT